MKKLFIVLLLSLFIVTGCGNSMTPTGAVEDYLGKYQSMDSEVLSQLDSVVSNDTTMSDDQKKEYKALMEKQYQYLSYKVTNEEIIGDTATVDVEIEVFDYASSIRKSSQYYQDNRDMFEEVDNSNDKDQEKVEDNNASHEENVNTDDNNVNNNASHEGNVNTDDGNIITETKKYIDYKIEQMKMVTDKIKYTITFNLSKEDDKWVVDDISDMDRKKIHGLFDE